MKYWVCAVAGLLLASGVLATNTAYAQKEWYPGEGAQEGLLVKYTVSFIDYKQGEPFDLTLWFESKDDKGNWKVFAIVEDKGQVVTSDVTLSSLNLTPLGFDVTPEFRPYRSAMKESIGWIASYASKADPKPLDSGTWGVIAALGGGGIVVGPAGAETITVAGKSWDASKIGFHYSEDSTIWVNDEFPLPLKAKVFALTTEKPVPVMFEFEMTEMSISKTRPVPPQSEVRIPKPPLSKPTTSGSFTVDLYWKPEKIETDNPVTFGVVIFDNRGNIVKDFLYAMTITDATGETLAKIKTSSSGGAHVVNFPSAGKAEVTVTYLGSFASPIEEKIIEKATFELIVQQSETTVPPQPPVKQLDISVAAKQTKKLTLISVKNNEDVSVYSVQFKATDGEIRFVKARGWDRDRIDQNTVAVSTQDMPLLPGRPLIVLLLSTNPAAVLEWTVLDQAGASLGNGRAEPRAG